MKTNNASLRTLATLVAGLLARHLAPAATVTWSGASGTDLLWSTPGNWLGGTPGTSSDIKFYDAGADVTVSNINNIVDANSSVLTLQYGNTNSYHTTLIRPGVTLMVSNNATGNLVLAGTGTDNGAGQTVTATVTGPGGALVAVSTNTGSAFNVRQSANLAGAHRATLDLSGLDSLTLTAGRLLVGGDGGSGALNRPAGTLILARTNIVRLNGSAPAFNAGEGSSNGGTEFVQLGQTNALFADSIGIGRQKSTATLNFNPSLAGNNPALYLRGNTAPRVSLLTIADTSAAGGAGTGTGCNGTADFGIGTVDAQVNTCYVARGQNAAAAGQAIGKLTLSGGVFDVNTLEVGIISAVSATANVTGTVSVSNATLVVNTALRLGGNPGATATANSTLNVNGGIVRAKAITTTAGTVNGTINLTSSLLAVTNGVGGAGMPIANVILADSVLQLGVLANSTMVVGSLTASGSTTNNTVDILSLPAITSYPVTFSLISYSSYGPGATDFVLGSLPAGSPAYSAYLTNNSGNNTIQLVVETGPAPVLRALTWNGNVDGNWNMTTANWLNTSLAGTTYAQNDLVTFNDTASGTTTVNLTTNLIPGSLLVSNDIKSYTFSGTGSISGGAGLIKEGANSLTLANSGADSFNGSISLNAGSLIYNRTGNTVEAHFITGAGSLVKNGAGTLTLGTANGYSGGSTVNAGTLRLSNANSAGSGSLEVNSAAILVAGASTANLITLSNATLGGSSAAVTLSGGLTIPSCAAGTIYTDDPQNPGAFVNLIFTGPLSGSGSLSVLPSAMTTNADSTTAAWRLNGTTDGGYSGTITVNSRVKAEIRYTAAYPFSSAGAGKLVLDCGTNAPSGQVGSYCNLLVRNDSGGYATFGNDVQLAGTGFAALNPLGTSPAGSLTTMGNLTIGNGQNLGVYRNGGNVMTVVFPTVTLTGGTATFSPRPSSFDPSVNGSDLSLGDISQTAASGLVMTGLRTLSITGTATYTGSTTVSNGTLNVTGSLNGGGAVTVAGGRLAGTGTIAGPVTVPSGGTLAPGTVTALAGDVNQAPIFGVGTLTINNNLTLAGNVLLEVDNSLYPASDVVNVAGTLTYGGTLTATNSGPGMLSVGDQFQVFKAGGSSNFTSILGSPGAGLAWSFNPATGILSVLGAPPRLGLSQTGNVLTFSWAEAGFKLQSQTNAASAGLSTNWFDYPNGGTSPVETTIDPANPSVFFRLISQ